MKSRSNIYIFSAPVQSGKTTLLMNWIKRKENVCGILAPDVDGKRKLFDISTKTYFDFETDNHQQTQEIISVGKFHFYREAFAQAQIILSQSIIQTPEWLIVDEVGKLELYEKNGLEPAVTNIINHYQQNKTDEKLLLVIRDSLLAECIVHYGLQNSVIIPVIFFNAEK